MDFSKLDNTDVEGFTERPDAPEYVSGRILHHDSDFLAYQCGYKWETESLDVSIEHLRKAIQTSRIMAGAEFIYLYLTMGEKSGRYEAAVVKEYQANRSDRDPGLMKRVAELRLFMSTCSDPCVIPKPQYKQEADDALCQAMQSAKTEPELHVLWSMDKDLWMVGGKHVNATTYEIEEFPFGYGRCLIDDTGTRKKLTGKGTSFFWHQMLMGDSADNIPGIPELARETVLKYLPSNAILKAQVKIRSVRTSGEVAKAKKSLANLEAKVKPKKCGAVAACSILVDITSDKVAYRVVRECYYDYYGSGTVLVQKWDGTVIETTAGQMMLEQAKLLWMQRSEGEDVLDFFKEINE